MKTLYNKVRAVKKLYYGLEKEISKFKEKTGLDCIKNCSACCQKPDIEATVLEFLPLAYEMYRKGRALEMIKDMENLPDSSICRIYAPIQTEVLEGGCSEYPERGLICRLFGFAHTRNKSGEKLLVTCRVIKTEFALQYADAHAKLNSSLRSPGMNEFYMKLYNIDPNLATKYYPINEAIRRALVYVEQYYSYRRKRAG
ncbi:MAG: YkgJ family cysteine cluster protein [Candidatus Kapaibacterium sp.]